jgi:hypothetical protein
VRGAQQISRLLSALQNYNLESLKQAA